jgi:hypothetical protein
MYTFHLIYLGILFAFKHVWCEYFLQKNGSSGAKRLKGKDGLKALFLHSSKHGTLTLCMSLGYFVGTPTSWTALAYVAPLWLGLFDFITHFGIDFAKVRVEWAFQGKSWKYLMIVDQLLHFVVTYVIIEFILMLA